MASGRAAFGAAFGATVAVAAVALAIAKLRGHKKKEGSQKKNIDVAAVGAEGAEEEAVAATGEAGGPRVGHYTCVIDRSWCESATGDRGEAGYAQLQEALSTGLRVAHLALAALDSRPSGQKGGADPTVGRGHVCKILELLKEVQEQSSAAPERWLLGRAASVRELCARVEALVPTKVVEGEEAPELPENRLLRAKDHSMALLVALQVMAGDPWDEPDDQDSHYANSITQDTRRKN